jgi:hypothetical protein
MALDLTRALTLRVAVDGAREATAELASMDHAQQGVEASARKASPAIDKVANSARLTAAEAKELSRQLAANGGDLSKVQLGASKVTSAFGALNATHKDTIQMSDLVSGRLNLQARAVETLYARLAGLGQQNSIVVRGLGSLAEAAGLSMGATLGILGAVALMVGAVAEEAKVVMESSKLFFEQATSMRGARTELDHLTEVWHDWGMTIGSVALGPQSAPISFFQLLERGLNAVASRFTVALAEGKAFVAWLSTTTLGVDVTNPNPSATSPNDDFRKLTEQSVLGLARRTHVTPIDPQFLSPYALAIARRMHNGVPFNNYEDFKAAEDKAHAEDKAAAERERAAMNELTGTSTLTDAATDMRRLSGLDINALPIASLQKVNDVLQNAIDVYRLRGQVAPEALQNEAFAVNQLVHGWDLATRAQDRYQAQQAAEQAANFAAFGAMALHVPIAYAGTDGDFLLQSRDYSSNQTGLIPGFRGGVPLIGRAASDPGNLAIKPPPAPNIFERLGTSLIPDLGKTLERLLIERGSPGSALGATVGGDVFSTLMGKGTAPQLAISGALTGLLGKQLGGLAGSFLPFGGQLLGSLVGSIFGKLFGETQGHKDLMAGNSQIADMKKQLDDLYGSASTAQAAAKMLGVDLAGAWGSQNLAGAKQFQSIMDDLAKKQAEFNDKLGGTLSKIQDLGGGIPTALQPYLDQLKTAKILTQDNLDLIGKMAGDQVPTWQKMEEVAGKYNLTIAQLGPNFQNQKLHASFQDIIDDVDLLVRGGADVNTMLVTVGADGSSSLTGLGQSVQDLVQQSQQFGIDIPNNMKPWIQKLIDSGDLLGADHQKITDINKLHFGGDMQTTLQTLNDTLKELIDKLGVKLPEAIGKVPRNIDIDVNYHTHGSIGDGSTGDGSTGGAPGGDTSTTAHYGGLIMHGGGLVDRLHAGGMVHPLLTPGSKRCRVFGQTPQPLVAEEQVAA